MPTSGFQAQRAVEFVLHLNLFRITSMQKNSKQHSQNRWLSNDGRSKRPSSQPKPGLSILVITTGAIGLRLLPGSNKQIIDPPPANILTIALCPVRTNHMSAYGCTTPFMKSLLGESVVLDDWSSPWIAQTYSGPMRKHIDFDAQTIKRLRTLGYV